jgi:type IV pilus assembly protein PilM
MAGSTWGIDIGQCGLKALRGKLGADGKTMEIESFDYVEYPQILSQADANPDELIREALKTFLSRNTLRGDKVAISLPGQAGLSRFIKLPPVEPKQLPALVGFEAKQQIPFDLEDVVWDYQQMPGCDTADDDDDDLPMENEVGLFAIKRDQLLRATRPLIDAEVELDFIQLAPIAIYNAIIFDQLPHESEEGAEIDRNEWICILSMGTDTSDLVLTNGFRVWQRSVPLGGNHFTKQVTNEMKLTFAKAELLKRNARDAAEAKAIFQAMRPTFKDLVTEVQRSLGYFASLDREAKITKIVALGNAMKLPGLSQYIEKNTEIPVSRIDSYERLTGPDIEVPAFKENALAFPVCYGLVLQGTGAAKLRTNLVPGEIITQRLIRRKKPWATAIAASLLLALAFNYFFNWRAWSEVHPSRQVNGVTWERAKQQADQLSQQSSTFKSRDEEQKVELARLDELGEAAVGSADGRLLWLELMRAITESLPRDPDVPAGTIASLDQKPLKERVEIYIDSIESEYFTDLATDWYAANGIAEKYQLMKQDRRGDDAGLDEPAAEGEEGDVPVEEAEVAIDEPMEEAPTVDGSGWVIEIRGHHFHHNSRPVEGTDYVRKHLIDQLDGGKVTLPLGSGEEMETFGVRELGILAPVEIAGNMNRAFEIPNPKYEGTVSSAPGQRSPGRNDRRSQRRRGRQPDAGTTESKESPTINVPAYEFTIQFCWKQISAKERLENRRRAAEAAATEEGEF